MIFLHIVGKLAPETVIQICNAEGCCFFDSSAYYTVAEHIQTQSLVAHFNLLYLLI